MARRWASSAQRLKLARRSTSMPTRRGRSTRAPGSQPGNSSRTTSTTLICDNMAAYFMGQGRIKAVIVGADRIASNGDTANKIGTYGVAILAKEHGIPFYV